MVIVTSTKEQLIQTAERLVALHGIDNVSLRQIGAEAGMANNSVVQYHFGSKEGLIQAILDLRLPPLNRRRDLLTARAVPDDVRSVVEAQLLPIIEAGEDEEGYFLMFLDQLHRSDLGAPPFDRLGVEADESRRSYEARLERFLRHLPPRLRRMRMLDASLICFNACADRQRRRHQGATLVPYGLHVAQLLDGLVAFLVAEPSPETLAALKVRRAVPV